MTRIITDFADLVTEDYEHLSMGIRPSGRIHVGSLLTILNGIEYLRAHDQSTFEIQVMDLDFDNQRGDHFVPYIHMQGPEGSRNSARQQLRQDLHSILNVMIDLEPELDLDGRVSISNFSDFLYDTEVLDFFSDILTDRDKVGELRSILWDQGKSNKTPLSGICPSCHYSNSNWVTNFYNEDATQKIRGDIQKIISGEIVVGDERRTRELIVEKHNDITRVEREIEIYTHGNAEDSKFLFKDTCKNDDCGIDDYVVDVRRPTAYNVHYLIDPLRDALSTDTHPRNDLHIFGGDYGAPYGTQGTPKSRRIQLAMKAIGLNPVDAFVGPLITYNGAKMGKSGASVSVNELGPEGILQHLLVITDILRERSSEDISYRKIQEEIDAYNK